MRQFEIAILVPPRASLFELATPIGVWGSGRGATLVETSPFSLTVCGPDSTIDSNSGLHIGGLRPMAEAKTADMVVVPTWPTSWEANDEDQAQVGQCGSGQCELGQCEAIVEAIRSANKRGATVVGLCLGAFAVAEAGLLEGREAVTHWAHRERFARLFPAVTYAKDALYVDHGDVVTSAGSAAALDCCLHLVRSKHGAEVATRIARSLVTPPHREGNQTQYVPPNSVSNQPEGSNDDGVGGLASILHYALSNLDAIGSVADLVDAAGMSRRSLERAFANELAVTPSHWLADQRVHRARVLLETTDLSIEDVATRSGHGSAPSLRRHIRDALGTTPTAYRSAFRE